MLHNVKIVNFRFDFKQFEQYLKKSYTDGFWIPYCLSFINYVVISIDSNARKQGQGSVLSLVSFTIIL